MEKSPASRNAETATTPALRKASRSWRGGALAIVLGASLSLAACTTSTEASSASTAATTAASQENVASQASAVSGVWDSSAVHSVELSVNDADLASLMSTYLASGEKVWISASVTIDGVTYENVGLKLKGNSSLRGVSADEAAEDLPWVIKLDKYVDGQNFEGSTEFVIRSNSSATSLNEAVALDLLDAAGLASEEAAAVTFSVNGSATTLRLMVENPNDAWMERELGDGMLYKAESGGSWDYLGEDPDLYASSFDQEGGEDDLSPLIDFLEFINTSDDATFTAELSEWLDVDSFATYLAYQQLVDNFDDIDGPGNNAYLYFDLDTGIMTVVNWDLNLAFGASPAGGGEGGGVGGQDAGGAGQLGGIGQPGGDGQPGGGQPGGGGRPAGGMDDAGAGIGGGMGGGGGMSQSNVLSERFLANADFAALVDAEVDRLSELFFGDGAVAQSSLDAWTATLLEGAGQSVDASVIEQESAALAQKFVA